MHSLHSQCYLPEFLVLVHVFKAVGWYRTSFSRPSSSRLSHTRSVTQSHCWSAQSKLF